MSSSSALKELLGCLAYLVACEVEFVPQSEHNIVIWMHDLVAEHFQEPGNFHATFRGVDFIFEFLQRIFCKMQGEFQG